MTFVLGIETSCDDTAVALVDEKGVVRSSLFANQDELHAPYGGVVPEMASRRHTEQLLPLIERLLAESATTWDRILGIAVTSRPGLIGSLLVGVVTAKTLALAKKKKLIGVNHIEGHLLAPLLSDESYQPPAGFDFPFLGLAVSGGHTHLFRVGGVGDYRLLGQTRDDAAGEAFDKFAKFVGLGFPGGAKVDGLARSGNPKAFNFPRGLIKEDSLDFSFSGLKTAAMRELENVSAAEIQTHLQDLCASFQVAVVDVLIAKLERAVVQNPNVRSIAITGGVSANSLLRERTLELAVRRGKIAAIPPTRYCTDNAAMIALAGLLHFQKNEFSTQELSPKARSLETDFT